MCTFASTVLVFAFVLLLGATVSVDGQPLPPLDPYGHVNTTQQTLRDPNAPAIVYAAASARVISNAVCAEERIVHDARGLNTLLVVFGQLIDHDIVLTPALNPRVPWNIAVPTGDPVFDPTSAGGATLPFTRTGRRPRNLITPFVDGSCVYGSDDARLVAIRVDDPQSGALRVTPGTNLLPPNIANLPVANANPHVPNTQMFLAGDVRASEQIFLSALHTIFVRYHNWIVSTLGPGFTGDEAFDRARQLTVAVLQHITYDEYLPTLLGLTEGTCAEPTQEPTISDATNIKMQNVFSAAAYRFGHSMVANDVIIRLRGGMGTKLLRDFYFQPDVLRNASSFEGVVRAMYKTPARAADLRVTADLRDLLFHDGGTNGQDLAAINIQRGRDVGVPQYNEVRVAFGFDEMDAFSDFVTDPVTLTGLESVYPGGPDECDTWVCGLAEPPIAGGSLGELNTAIIADQFCTMAANDPNFWTRASYLGDVDRAFIATQGLKEVLCVTVGGLLCEANDNAFLLSGHHSDSRAVIIGTIVFASVLVCCALALVWLIRRSGNMRYLLM